jgi:hypothetical protein
MNRKENEAKRRSPADIKWGRSFRRLSRYDILLLGRICEVDAEPIYKMSDEDFDKWIILGE